MKETKYTFKRYEKKFILTPEEYELFMRAAGEHFIPDEYHKSSISSIYYDDDSYSLIRHSLEAPVYKEKIRLRSYKVPTRDDTVFVELKKKYKGVVYKRRAEIPVLQAERWLSGQEKISADTQTLREIDWFVSHNALLPKAYIGVDRTSWVDKSGSELRVTFDENICWRSERLSLTDGRDGELLLKDGKILMEIKIPGAAPLWLASLLSDQAIFPQKYSKYGTCYTEELIKNSQFAELL